MSCESLDSRISSFERAMTLRAHEHEGHAERVRGELPGRIPGRAPKEYADSVRAHGRGEIDHHEAQAKAHRRRAEFAREGYVLSDKLSRMDLEHKSQHGALYRDASAAGRLHHVDD